MLEMQSQGIMRNLLLYLFLFLCGTQLQSQTSHSNLRAGDQHYQEEVFYLAELEYRKAENENSSFKSAYNLGNSLYKQERYEEAAEQFNRALSKTGVDTERSMTFQNMGNSYFYQQKFEEAILYYKDAIRADPSNMEAKYNLSMTKEILRQAQPQQQQQQQQQQQDQENQEEQDQENQEEQENQEQNENAEQQDSTQQEQNPQDSLSEQDINEASLDSSRLDKNALDSLDAVKLLQIIENEEKKVQEKLKKFNSSRKKSDKNW